MKKELARPFFLVAALWVILAQPASAQTDSWQRYPAPILLTGPAGSWDDVLTYAPRILKRTDGRPYVDADGRYYLFYTGSGRATIPRDQTGLARSTTLLSWERVSASRPVLPLGADGAHDQGDASAVTILEDDGLFHMWYEGNGRVVSSDFVTINYATSRDAVAWTKYAGNPILRQSPGDDSEDLYAPIVIKDEGAWKMWYTGHDDRGRYGLMYATAPAPEGPWRKHGNSFIFHPGDLFPCEVWKDAGVYHLLYMRSDSVFREIRLATSINGIEWIDRGVVFEVGPLRAWDSRSVRWPTQIPVGDRWITFYYGFGFGQSGIGIATSHDRYGFVSGGAGSPGPPLRAAASASGRSTRMTWSPPVSGDPPLVYLVEVGSRFGAADIGSFEVQAGNREVAMRLPEGHYFARVKARNGSGTGAPSHDIWFEAGDCGARPQPSSDVRGALLRDSSGSFAVDLSWQPSAFGCDAVSWIVEVGSVPGVSDVAVIEITDTSASFSVGGKRSTFYVRVRGKNQHGIGPPSDERRLAIGGVDRVAARQALESQ
jgi:predicted GH43/DUF377 family glycosyl hydrolase